MRCVGAELNDPTHLKKTEFPSLLDILVYVAPVSIKQYCRYRLFFFLPATTDASLKYILILSLPLKFL